MTRKKFIKKLMAYGISRNDARAIALETQRAGMSYADKMSTVELQAVRAVWEAKKTIYAIVARYVPNICKQWQAIKQSLEGCAAGWEIISKRLEEYADKVTEREGNTND